MLTPQDRAVLLEKTSGVGASAKSRYKSEVEKAAPNLWQLVDKAEPEESAHVKDLVLTLASASKRSVLIGQYGVVESDSCGATMEACEIETPPNVELGAHERVSCERTDRSRVDGQNRVEVCRPTDRPTNRLYQKKAACMFRNQGPSDSRESRCGASV